MKKLLIAAAAALCASAASAAVYDTAGVRTGNDGNQDYGQMLGLDFTVNVSGLQVTELGAFNDDLKGITTDITVGLYDLTLGAAVISPISFNGTVGGTTYLFKSLGTPVALIAGHQYSVQAFGYNTGDENYNTNFLPEVNNAPNDPTTTPITFNSMGGWLTNNNSRYGGATMGTGTAFAHSSAFGAGTLTVTAVPEPETYAMLLAGLGVIGFLGKRRNKG